MKNAKKTETAQTQPSSDKVFEPADYDKLRETIVSLDPADDSRWNQAGGPNMNYLKEFMGRVVTADHIKSCGAGEWTREVAQDMADKKAAGKSGGEPGEGVAGTAMGPVDPESSVALDTSPEQDHGPGSVDDADSGVGYLEGDPVTVIAPAETELERQKREREDAREKRLQRDATGANIHDERSIKVREQAKALQKLDKEKAKKEKQAEKDAAEAEEKRIADHAERIAVEPSKGEFADPGDAEARFDDLERVAMTLVKVLLDMPLSPVQRSKVLGCDELICNLSDSD